MKHLLFILILSFCSLASTCNKTPINSTAVDLSTITAPDEIVSFSSECKESINYVPDLDNPEHTPTRYVKVNVHVMDNDDGTLMMPDRIARQIVKLMIDSANVRLKDNRKMRLPRDKDNPVYETRFQYVLTPDPSQKGDDGVYFHDDSEMCYFNSDRKSKDETHNMFSKKQYDKYGVQKEDVLNIFMMEHHPDSIATRGKKRNRKKYQKVLGVGYKHWVKLTGFAPMYERTVKQDKASREYKTSVEVVANFYSRLLNHEIGHSLGLGHTWSTNDGCDDTPKNNNCWYRVKGSRNCDWDDLSNNVMDYNAFMAAYSACQIGRVHYNFSKENSSQRGLLRPDWCSYQAEEKIVIKSGENVVWNDAKDFPSDIVVEKNANLEINCVVSLPEGAKVIVEEKGNLHLGPNAHITNRCGGSWGGIETRGKATKQPILIDEGAKVSNLLK